MIIDFFEAKTRIEQKEAKQKVITEPIEAVVKSSPVDENPRKAVTPEQSQCKITFHSSNTVFFYEKSEEGKFEYIGQSYVLFGKRTFHRRDPGSPYVDAKDCTPKKIKDNPHNVILKYLPEWEGKTVIIGNRWNPSVTLNKADGAVKTVSKKVDPSSLDFQFNEGDIFYTSWGYDQTNTSFYQIISRTARTATVRRIASETVKGSASYDSARIKPVKGKFIEEETRACRIRVRQNKEDTLCNVDGDHTGYPTSENASHYCSWGR